MEFEIISKITDIQTVEGRGIRDLRRIRRFHGPGNWKKKKGNATIKLLDVEIREAEIHWYEAHGVGKKDFKWKRFLD